MYRQGTKNYNTTDPTTNARTIQITCSIQLAHDMVVCSRFYTKPTIE